MLKGAELARTVRFLPLPTFVRVGMQPLLRVPGSSGEEEAVLVRVAVVLGLADGMRWSDKNGSGAEHFLVYVQDEHSRLLHFDTATLRKPMVASKQAARNEEEELLAEVEVSFHLLVPLPLPEAPWFVYAESERWMGVHATATLSFEHPEFTLPRSQPAILDHSSAAAANNTHALPLEDSGRVPFTTLADAKYEQFFRSALLSTGGGAAARFGLVESTLFGALFLDGRNLVLAAAAGNGVDNGTCAELALCRALIRDDLQHSRVGGDSPHPQMCRVLCLSAQAATTRLRVESWKRRLGSDERRVLCMTGQEWLQLPGWRRESLGGSITLLLAEELHLIGCHESDVSGSNGTARVGATLELAISGLLREPSFADRRQQPDDGGAGELDDDDAMPSPVRVIGLAGASLAPESASDLADWLGVTQPREPHPAQPTEAPGPPGAAGPKLSLADIQQKRAQHRHRPSKQKTQRQQQLVFNFSNSVRPVPQELLVKKFEEKLLSSRLATMNKPCFQALHANRDEEPDEHGQRQLRPAIVFVSSAPQCRLTAQALISLSTAASTSEGGGETGVFMSSELRVALEEVLGGGGGGGQQGQEGSRHPAPLGMILTQALRWGVGLHYTGMAPQERELVESLWKARLLKVLVATPELAWETSARPGEGGMVAPLVVIKGTERPPYSNRQQRGGGRDPAATAAQQLQPYSQPEMLQMISRACWAEDDVAVLSAGAHAQSWEASQGGHGGPLSSTALSKARVVVMCQDILKDYWVTALFCPMALESSLPLPPQCDHGGGSFLERRMHSNPSYYR